MGISSQRRGSASKMCRFAAVLAVGLALSACTPTYRNYGYVPSQEDLDQIAVGVDTRASVEETLGAGGAASVLEDDALYFVRSRVRSFAMFEPEVVERDVVAVSFDQSGVVQNVETFGLERGQVVRFSRRVTDSSVAGKSFFEQLFGNVGGFSPFGSAQP